MSIDEILEDPELRWLDDEWRFMCFQRDMEARQLSDTISDCANERSARQQAIDDMND